MIRCQLIVGVIKSQVAPALECRILVLYPLHQNIKGWNSCIALRNCRQPTENPESKCLDGHFVFYRSKKYSKLVIYGTIPSQRLPVMPFSCFYKGVSFTNEPNTHVLVRSHFFSRHIYEKSTFARDTIAPYSTSF